jgi:hypothetical protein
VGVHSHSSSAMSPASNARTDFRAPPGRPDGAGRRQAPTSTGCMRTTWSASSSTGRPPIPLRSGGGTSGAITPGRPRASSSSGSAGQTSRHQCQVAAQVAAVLRQRGWTGAVRRCGPARTAGAAPPGG